MLPISWSVTALDDLDTLTDYIAEFDVRAAIAMHDLIEESVRPVSNYPNIFRQGRIPGTREIVAHPNYIIVYRVTDTAIEVINVLHSRQEYP